MDESGKKQTTPFAKSVKEGKEETSVHDRRRRCLSALLRPKSVLLHDSLEKVLRCITIFRA